MSRASGDDGALAIALRELGEAAVGRNDYGRAFALYEESLAVARAAGESTVPIVTNLADLALAAGELERAIEYSAEAAARADGPDAETVTAIASFNTASALIQLGRGAEARPHLRESLETVVRLDYPELIGWCLVATAALAAAVDPAAACLLLGAAETAVESAGARLGAAEQRLREWVLSQLRGRIEQHRCDESLQAGGALAAEDAASLARKYLG
jgi:tetratricopeptide (TPR) repeat protein